MSIAPYNFAPFDEAACIAAQEQAERRMWDTDAPMPAHHRAHAPAPRLFESEDLPLFSGGAYGPVPVETNATQDAAQHQDALPGLDLRPVFGETTTTKGKQA